MKSPSGGPEVRSYQLQYEEFDSPLMTRLRKAAYQEDIGQYSWVTAEDLRRDMAQLNLTAGGRLLDLGCGPCGPLTFIMASVGCAGVGLDQSAAALDAGRRRAAALNIGHRLAVHAADLDAPLPIASGAADAVIALDVILHLRDRSQAFREVARVLAPGGRFLFTDAGIVTGALSSAEVASRSLHGVAHFCAPGYNEAMLAASGLELIATEDRTAGLLENAEGRLLARLEEQVDIERVEGVDAFARYQEYLRSIIVTAQRGALARMMYLAQAPAG